MWRGVLKALTASGKEIGPGLGHKLVFEIATADSSERLEAVDNLDGTYTVEIETTDEYDPPWTTLLYGSRRIRLPAYSIIKDQQDK